MAINQNVVGESIPRHAPTDGEADAPHTGQEVYTEGQPLGEAPQHPPMVATMLRREGGRGPIVFVQPKGSVAPHYVEKDTSEQPPQRPFVVAQRPGTPSPDGAPGASGANEPIPPVAAAPEAPTPVPGRASPEPAQRPFVVMRKPEATPVPVVQPPTPASETTVPPASSFKEIFDHYPDKSVLEGAMNRYAQSTAARRANAEGGFIHAGERPQKWWQRALNAVDAGLHPLARRKGKGLLQEDKVQREAYEAELNKFFTHVNNQPTPVEMGRKVEFRLLMMADLERRVLASWLRQTHADVDELQQPTWDARNAKQRLLAERWIRMSLARKIGSVAWRGAAVGALATAPLFFLTAPAIATTALGLGAAVAAKYWVGKRMNTVNKYQVAHQDTRISLMQHIERRLEEADRVASHSLRDAEALTLVHDGLTRELEQRNARRRRYAEMIGGLASGVTFAAVANLGPRLAHSVAEYGLPRGNVSPHIATPTHTTVAHPTPTPSPSPTPTPTPTPGGPGVPHVPPGVNPQAYPWDVAHQLSPSGNPLDGIRHAMSAFNQLHHTDYHLEWVGDKQWIMYTKNGTLHALSPQQQTEFNNFMIDLASKGN